MSLIIALLIVAGCIYFAHKEKIQLASKDSSVLGGVCGGIAKHGVACHLQAVAGPSHCAVGGHRAAGQNRVGT